MTFGRLAVLPITEKLCYLCGVKFRTETEPLRLQGRLTHSTPLLMLGSCFADSMAQRLNARLFNVLSNPFGTLYNPASIAQALHRIAGNEPFTEADFFYDPLSGLYHSFRLHTSLSRRDVSEAVGHANATLCCARNFLAGASWLTLTLGTSWVFVCADSPEEVVANCHKQPAANFARRFMSPEESASLITAAIHRIRREINPNIGVMLTVSPVRHAADGLHGNTLSKAALHLATQSLTATLADCHYFPAYEAVCDDLRDYRFYARDMRHPSDAAADYVYELLERSTMTADTIALASEALRLTQRAAHRDETLGNSTRHADLRRLAASLLQRCPALQHSIEQLLQSQL